MFDPLKTKYHPLYWDMAYSAARQSVAERHQVGALIVTPTGMTSPGWNGMPPGLSNKCENRMIIDPVTLKPRGKTDPRVIHAEMNALKKMHLHGIPTNGCLMFVTLSPCFQCAKSLVGLGFKAIIYDQLHDCIDGLDLLMETGTPVYQKDQYPF